MNHGVLPAFEAPRAYDVAPLQIDYTAEPTILGFHESDAFIRGVRGPVGSGKSVGTGIMEILKRAAEQAPDRQGRRRTRWGCVRNTYGELKTTTIKTVQDWLPEGVVWKFDEPISMNYHVPLGDGTTMHLEIWFIAVDRPAHIKKLKSLELTGVWLNEASELAKAVLDMASSRVGRFPSKKDKVVLTWCGVMMDTNSMDDDHWWHDLAEGPEDPERLAEVQQMISQLQATLDELGMKRPLLEFFDQPPALLEAAGSYVPNPEAENIDNLQLGFGYYLQLIAGKSKDWIDMYVRNQYGRVVDGKPIYPEYSSDIHGREMRLQPYPGLPIRIGLDLGLSPAAVPGQVTPKGQLLVLGECVALERSMGLRQFLGDALKPYLINRFGVRDQNGDEWKYELIGDPSGSRRAEGDEKTAFQIATEVGWSIMPAKTNAWLARREGLAWFLNGLVEGQPRVLIDSRAKMLKKGLHVGYHYRRIQVVGEARYQDSPYKNKYSHVCEAAQYLALEYVTVEAPSANGNMIPMWQRRLNGVGGAGPRAWRMRGNRMARVH